MRLAIVASRFNDALASQLLARAEQEAKKLGAQSQVVSVPGALEIPWRCNGWRKAATSTRWSPSAA